jgi:threonylcarbamoyladenosine tRNA methylthiotransferase MtaB
VKKVAFYTLGCKVNSYDSTYMQSLFEQKGYSVVAFGEDADIVVVNTCTVTAVADKKSRAAIRRGARSGKVIVAGCLAQKSPDTLLSIDGVDAVVGTDDRARVVDIAEQLLSGEKHIDATHALSGCGYEKMGITTPGDKTRGIIKIQEGCNCFCSYCIIPYVRGRSRSRFFDDIINEARSMAVSGVKELVLTGIHIASYNDNGRTLGDIVSALDDVGLRIRLGSVEPGILGEDFVAQAAAASRFCPHFHLSLQSGSASVLKRMNRPYTPEQYADFVSLLRRYFYKPAITTDVIAGFPAETEAEHEETMAFVERIGFSRIHVFPYSPREGTKAYEMTPKVPKALSRQRAGELIALGDRLEREYIASLMGEKSEVLFEEASQEYPGLVEGYSERYVRVAACAEKNEMRTVTLRETRGMTALGE